MAHVLCDVPYTYLQDPVLYILWHFYKMCLEILHEFIGSLNLIEKVLTWVLWAKVNMLRTA